MTEPLTSKFINEHDKTNTFRQSLKKALSYSLPELFNEAYETYTAHLTGPELNLSPKDMHLKMMPEIAQELFFFFNSKRFTDRKALAYLEVVENVIPAKIFAFLLWSQDKKNACIEVLKNNEIDLSEKEYDSLFAVLMPHTENRKVPYAQDAKIEYLAKQKVDFFSYHNKFKLARELDNEFASLPDHSEVKKRPKL